jgi:hypothetical protein
MNDVDGLASGPKKSRPPVGSPHPTGVPIVPVSMSLISSGIDRNKSNSVPPVSPVFERLKPYIKAAPVGVTVYVRLSAFADPMLRTTINSSNAFRIF